MLHPEESPRIPYIGQQLKGRQGPVICATDYIKSYGEQLRPYIESRYVVLGTDGYGRSDTRAKLRHHFEVDRNYVVLAALKALSDDGQLPAADVAKAIKTLGINPDISSPLYR